jgi:hypothetical protein
MSQSYPFRSVSALMSHSQLCGMQLEAKHALSAIHASMNTFPKINRLPPEILASIPSFLTSHKDLVSTTLVCRHWRNTIIASPPLWSFLDNDTMHSDLVAASMDRCGDAPLDVSFNSKFDKNTLFLKRVVLHSSRIRKMCIPCLHWSHLADLLDVFDKPLPLLRDVELSFCYYDEGPLPPFQRLFLTGATNLVSLNLSGYGMSSGTLLHFIAHALTHLKLSFNSHAPTVGELLEFLRTSPLIEDLRIHSEDILVASNFPFPDRFEPVELLSLRDIHFSWITAQSQCTLLRHIQYPPSCSVFLQFRSESDVAQPPQNTFPKSWEAFSLADPSCVTLRVNREPYSTECTVIVKKLNSASVFISCLQNVNNSMLVDGDGNVIREISRDRDDNQVLSDAIALIGQLPLQKIRKFVLEDLKADEMSVPESFEIPPALVKLICSDIPNLETLSLARTCVSELLKILTPPPPPPPTYIADLFDSDVLLEQTPPCPTLRVLEMRHPVWVTSRHCPEVLALAQARKDERVPFERVFLCSPTAPKSLALGMSRYVGEMDIKKCDGCD